jgi:SAM-dependent methyltransferase
MFPRAYVLGATLACSAIALSAQQPDAKQIAQERKQAEIDVPRLADVLELKPGMTVADVGAGNGNMSVVFGKWIGTGRVFATDIPAKTVAWLRQYVKQEGLTNVTVLEGAPDATNLPAACCDAIFLRNVYHHVTAPEPFNKSLVASLKPGGRLAILDNPPGKGSPLPQGVPANREGHGVPTAVVAQELTAAGLTHVKTIDGWPPGDECKTCFLALFKKELTAGLKPCGYVRRPLRLQVFLEELLDARPGVAQDVLAREVVELAGIHHELDEIALPFLHHLVHQADGMQVRHVDVGGAMQHEQRPHDLVHA